MLLHHFGSRNELLLAIVDQVERHQMALMHELPEHPADAIAAMWANLRRPELRPFGGGVGGGEMCRKVPDVRRIMFFLCKRLGSVNIKPVHLSLHRGGGEDGGGGGLGRMGSGTGGICIEGRGDR